jgi:hypothetical protein
VNHRELTGRESQAEARRLTPDGSAAVRRPIMSRVSYGWLMGRTSRRSAVSGGVRLKITSHDKMDLMELLTLEPPNKAIMVSRAGSTICAK